METKTELIDRFSCDCLLELKKLKKFTYKNGIDENILNKFLSNRFEQKYKLYVHMSKLTCDKVYSTPINTSCNSVNICFPCESIMITCSYNDAINLSGINNILIYDKTFIKFKTISNGMTSKSGPIIICKLPLESIICLKTNKHLIDISKGQLES